MINKLNWFNELSAKEFFEFIENRHEIYIKRFVRKEPAPWTTDPILQKKKFCNVYRDLDRGTKWIVNNVSGSPADKLFQIILYRLINNAHFFDEYGLGDIHGHLCSKGNLEDAMREYKKKHGKVFNSAYTVYKQFNKATSFEDTIKSCATIMDGVCEIIEEIYHYVEIAKSAEDVAKIIEANIPACGPFLAYEIYCDMVLVGITKFTENDYVNVGPGAEEGLRILFGEKFRNYNNAVYFLRDKQNDYLKRGIITKPLTLRSIEHSLCEFKKYYNIKQRGKGGKNFNPTTV